MEMFSRSFLWSVFSKRVSDRVVFSNFDIPFTHPRYLISLISTFQHPYFHSPTPGESSKGLKSTFDASFDGTISMDKPIKGFVYADVVFYSRDFEGVKEVKLDFPNQLCKHCQTHQHFLLILKFPYVYFSV